jgi:hypothetical protein
MNTASIIHILSIVLPFANEIAIVLTHSKLPIFDGLYKLCIDDVLLTGVKLDRVLKKICTTKNYQNKIIIDLIAYFGIILYIGKNTILYGYATGVVTGLILIFCSIILPNMFLGIFIEKITKILNIKSPHFYILIGILLIIMLIILTIVLETIAQNLTKSIKINPISENIEKRN